jgi:hypothetical protein
MVRKLEPVNALSSQQSKKIQRRSANIDEDMVKRVVSILENWDKPKLTWDSLTEELSRNAMPEYTRQALERQPFIKSAYASMKKVLRAESFNTRTPSRSTSSDHFLKIRALERKIERVEIENANLVERFLRWLHNANNFGLSVEQLERPLPTINRGGTPLNQGNRSTGIKKRGKKARSPN